MRSMNESREWREIGGTYEVYRLIGGVCRCIEDWIGMVWYGA